MKSSTAGAGPDETDGTRSLAEVLSDPSRLASLSRTKLLDSPPEEAFDRLTRLAARILRARVSFVSLLDDHRQFFKSAAGPDVTEKRETPLSHSYCQYVVYSGRPLVVRDARNHPLLRDSPAIEEDAISYCGVPISDPDGHTLGTLCVVDQEPRDWTDDEIAALTDLTGAAIAEVRLRLLAQELEIANETLRDMIATTTHDIRSPLTVIAGFAGLLRAEGELSAEDTREFADLIHEAATQANRLVGDLLEISKLEAGVVEPRPAALDLASAVEAARHQCGSPSSTDDVPVDLKVWADTDHLCRILTNLLSNAAKYGAPPVSVSAEEVGGRVLVHVADEGRGVPPDFVPHLFEKFARSTEAKMSGTEGTGLGLAIVAELARTNGGSAWYEPNSPRGSRFIVELPGAGATGN